MLDRIDLHIEGPAVRFEELAGKSPGEPSEPIRARVGAARRIRQQHFGKTRATCNARMSPRQLNDCCQLREGSQELLRVANEFPR